MYEESKKRVADFAASDGPKLQVCVSTTSIADFWSPCMVDELSVGLQAILEQRARDTVNWLDEWWTQAAYLTYRMPVVIYSAPCIMYPMVGPAVASMSDPFRQLLFILQNLDERFGAQTQCARAARLAHQV